MKNIFIYGASGHAKVIKEIIDLSEDYQVACFLDDNEALHGNEYLGCQILGGTAKLEDKTLSGMKGIIAIGDNDIRKMLYQKILAAGHRLASIMHPSAVVSTEARIGSGVVIVAGVVINPGTVIGDNVIINTAASVDHDCTIGAHAHIAPGCSLCGHVNIGEGVLLGVGSSVIPGVSIGDNTVIGAGAAVVSDLPSDITALGTPARIESANQ